MISILRLATWNINGLLKRQTELEAFVIDQKLDIVLISETHLTNKQDYHLKNYTFYRTDFPGNRPRGGTGILIHNRFQHHSHNYHNKVHLQATSVQLIEKNGKTLVFSAIYCPPRYRITQSQFSDFFKTLGDRFIAGGDFNSKHTYWGSRLITPKGRQLHGCIIKENFSVLSTGHPTYWPSDRSVFVVYDCAI